MPVTGDESLETLDSPWRDRQSRGFFSRFFGAVGWSMTRPADLVRSMPPKSSGALHFASIVYGLAFCTNTLLFFALIGLLAPGGGGGGGLGAVRMLGLMLLSWMVLPLFLAIPLQAVVAHALLYITGPRRAGVGTTLSCAYFAQGPMIITAIPLCGRYLGVIAAPWSLVVMILMLMEAQAVAAWRATVAVLAPALIAIALITAMVFWGISTAFNSMSQQSAMGAFRVPIGSNDLSSALGDAFGASGDRPRHVLEIVASSGLDAADLMGRGATSPSPARSGSTEIFLEGGLPLSRLDEMAPAEIREHVAGLDTDKPFYIAGVYVFCHRGLEDRDAIRIIPPDLWLAFQDPRLQISRQDRVVLLADGTMESIFSFEWDQARREQNRTRSALGLPIIPRQRHLPDRPAGAADSD